MTGTGWYNHLKQIKGTIRSSRGLLNFLFQRKKQKVGRKSFHWPLAVKINLHLQRANSHLLSFAAAKFSQICPGGPNYTIQ